ncbi:MAG: four helix bundle protein [Melioribacteraceae bacterium]|nr:four helix bundle protein [Melioribacteraceae bacterium]
MKRHNFKNLKIWQESMKLVSETYELTRKFPDFEKFGLVSQMNRCSVSIPSNIAEGAGRNSEKDFNRFLDIANGSTFELETQIILSFDLEYITEAEMNTILNQIEEVQKMIYGLKNKLK